jgi:hypothetical protein
MASAFRINLLPDAKIDRDTGVGSTGLGRSLRIPAAISWRVLNKTLMPARAMSISGARGKRATLRTKCGLDYLVGIKGSR